MAQLTKKKISISYIIWTIIGLVIMFFTAQIFPTWGPVTELGLSMVGVFVGLLVLITATNDTIWPSLAAYIALMVHGYMNASTATSTLIGTTVILQMIAVMVICSALRETGAGQVIAKKLLTIKAVQGKPLTFSIVFLVAFLIADIFLSTFGGILFAFAVFDSIIDALGYDRKDKYVKCMNLGLYLCAMLGSSLLPFSGMVLGITSAFNKAIMESGFGFNQAVYIISAIPAGVAFIVMYAVCMKYVFKCDMSKLYNLDVNKLESLNNVESKFNKIQIVYLCSFIFGIAYSFALLLIPKSLSWYPTFASITQCGWFVIVIIILTMIRVGGKPLMDVGKHFKEGAVWSLILPVGIFTAVGGAMSASDLGFGTWLMEFLSPIFTNMSWPIFVLLIVLICSVVTNFFSNMATGVIVSSLTAPFAIAYASTSGINISVIATAIAFSSMFAYMTYAAAGPAPLILRRDGVDNKFVWSTGVLTLILYIVVATIVFTILGYIY
ncbi:MAG: SLC13 family permease [Clostridiales bacterium]|nr:SLC13 family permease [Clostridiales bacterium]